MRALCLHAHFDDFELTAAGTFLQWEARLGSEFTGKLVVCTDGKAGHHLRSREETGRIRLAEQAESARIGGYPFEVLSLPDGTVPRDGCLQLDRSLLAALWKTIREFEPDYLFCPPVPSDPLAGIHVDHATLGEAVRRVAYMINVPHAFTPEYPDETKGAVPVKVPVILALYDTYQFGTNQHDLAIDVEPAFERIVQMSWCHQSQIREWIPWVGRHPMPAPASLDEWRRTVRDQFRRANRDTGLEGNRAVELFSVTAWGEVPTYDQLLRDFPDADPTRSNLESLRARLSRWRQD